MGRHAGWSQAQRPGSTDHLATMELQRLSLSDGGWADLCRQWEGECISFGEELSDFALGSFPVLDQLARGPQLASAGVFATSNDSGHPTACQVNVTLLPGYEGKVLRVRHILFSPRYDLDDIGDSEEYARVLVSVFAGAILLSYETMPAEHVKFHLRSPAEMQFGHMFTEVLQEHEVFNKVAMRGAWIYLSKS